MIISYKVALFKKSGIPGGALVLYGYVILVDA